MVAETMRNSSFVIVSFCLFVLVSRVVPALVANDGDLERWARILADAEADTLERLEAAIELGEAGDPQYIPHLAEVLKDDNKAVRWAAVKALWEYRDDATVPILVEYLEKEEGYAWGKILTMGALGSSKDPRAVDPLLKMLGNGNPFLRRSAALALSNIGGDKAVLGIIGLLEDEQSWLARMAHGLLVQLSQQETQAEIPRGFEEWMKWYQATRGTTPTEGAQSK